MPKPYNRLSGRPRRRTGSRERTAPTRDSDCDQNEQIKQVKPDVSGVRNHVSDPREHPSTTSARWLLRAVTIAVVSCLIGVFGVFTPVVGAAPSDGGEVIGGQQLANPGLLVQAPPGTPPPPAFPASCYLVADLNSGDIVLSQCAHTRSLPASTLKALSALVLQPKLSPDSTVVATDEDARIDGTKVGLVPGQSYTVDQLLAALLMSSGNDAANALARANGGLAATATQMNEQAAHLGAFDTNAVNDSGLDAHGQVSSVYDLALIGRELLRNERLVGYVTTKKRPFPGRPAGPGAAHNRPIELSNHNSWLYNVPGTVGIKNGYTAAAGHTFIGAVRRGERGYLLTYMGRKDRGWRPPAALIEWAFKYGPQCTSVGRLVDPGTTKRPEGAPGQAREPGAFPMDTSQGPPVVAIENDRIARPDRSWSRNLLTAAILLLAVIVTAVALRLRAIAAAPPPRRGRHAARHARSGARRAPGRQPPIPPLAPPPRSDGFDSFRPTPPDPQPQHRDRSQPGYEEPYDWERPVPQRDWRRSREWSQSVVSGERADDQYG